YGTCAATSGGREVASVRRGHAGPAVVPPVPDRRPTRRPPPSRFSVFESRRRIEPETARSAVPPKASCPKAPSALPGRLALMSTKWPEETLVVTGAGAEDWTAAVPAELEPL